MFVHGLPASAFILSALLTFIFIMLVNVIVHFSLKKIDMVESLKSVRINASPGGPRLPGDFFPPFDQGKNGYVIL